MVHQESASNKSERAMGSSGSIVSDGNGTYRWVHELNLFTNPTILLTVLKVFIGIVVGLGAFMLALLVPDLVRGHADSNDAIGTLHMTGLLALLFVALTIVGYFAYALMQGGTYCVVFTMDERGIIHKQLPRQFEKTQVLNGLNVLAGLAAGNLSQMGMGILNATHDTTVSDFASVRSVKGSRALHVIKVNESLSKNQVYVDPEDYDFVFGFIRDHCPNATVKG
ncbi:MAG: hypothetical protein IJ131_08090 [Eggerthellaceae bacterium]|nr:hypothetical protein [Eggerthellaceae bacterium]